MTNNDYSAKVSIIIPIYNVEKYLSKCLDSCINQTLLDIEIICVDDGSTDRSGKIADTLAAHDSRVTVIHKENGGVSSARNVGLKKAKGKFIMFVDSDDWLENDACATVWEEYMDHPIDILAFGAKLSPAYPRPEPWIEWATGPRKRFFDGFNTDFISEEGGSFPFIWNKAYSKEFLDRTGVTFPEDIPYGEDNVFLMSIYPQGRYYSYITKQLYNYRWYREGSWMNQSHELVNKKLKYHVMIMNRVAEYWNEKGFIEKYGTTFLRWLLIFMVPDILKDDAEDKKGLAGSTKQVIEKYDLKKYESGLKGTAKKYLNQLYSI